MTEYAPLAIQHLFDTVKAAIPSAQMAGIVGDQAHTYGYHRGRNYVSSSDYSNQLAKDTQGVDGEAACALDISWSTAQPQYTVSQRLLAAKTDPRMTKAVRSFFGSTDGVRVVGWDYQGQYSCTSDSSHLWHVHISLLRSMVNDHAAMQGVAAVITGGSAPPPTGEWDEMASKDEVKSALREVLNEGTAQGTSSWAATNKGMYDRTGTLVNQTGKSAISAGAMDALMKGTGQGTTGWPATNQNTYNRTGDIINRLATVQSDLDDIKAQLGVGSED